MNTLEVESTCGTATVGMNHFPIDSVRAKFGAGVSTVLPTAEITIRPHFFPASLLGSHGLPERGTRMRIVDEVFGDHVYTIVGAEERSDILSRPIIHLTCLIDPAPNPPD